MANLQIACTICNDQSVTKHSYIDRISWYDNDSDVNEDCAPEHVQKPKKRSVFPGHLQVL